MSDTIDLGFDLESAVKYNEYAARALGWYGHLPSKAVASYPGLACDPLGSPEQQGAFARGVLAMQQDAFPSPDDHDGKLGSGTQKAMQLKFDFVEEDRRHFLFHKMRKPIVNRNQVSKLYTYENPFGLDLHHGGWHRSSSRRIKFIVLHWGGLSAEHCYRVLRNRNLASHFGVELDTVYQWLDIAYQAWHAGHANKHCIGIDICQQPTTKYFERYRNAGFQIEKVKNPTDRGDDEIITLDPRTVQSVRELLTDLCDVFNIPKRVPRGNDGWAKSGAYWHGVFDKQDMIDGDFHGVVGHHHISASKWDVAPWWHQIFNEWGD